LVRRVRRAGRLVDVWVVDGSERKAERKLRWPRDRTDGKLQHQ
jgi:hypothetical protein